MSFQLTIEPEWNIIGKIREAINREARLNERGRDFVEATRITAIELVENALKYSDAGAGDQPVLFSFDMDSSQDRVTITIINPCTDDKKKTVLQNTIKEIKQGNPFDLYVSRLEQLKDHPDGFSRMGLYRIAYEGEFDLDIETSSTEIKIIASRKLEA